MTIYEAFRNRGLLAVETMKPYYRITYGYSKYDKRTVIFQCNDWKTAKDELTEKWRAYAEARRIREDSVLEIHCIPEPGKKERGF